MCFEKYSGFGPDLIAVTANSRLEVFSEASGRRADSMSVPDSQQPYVDEAGDDGCPHTYYT